MNDSTQPRAPLSRFRIEFQSPDGEITGTLRTDNKVEAMRAYVEMSKRDFGKELGPGSNLAITDNELKYSAGRVSEGKGTYKVQFATEAARELHAQVERVIAIEAAGTAKLSPREHATAYDKAEARYLSYSTPQDHPIAIITGGQPGSGKSGLTNQAKAELAERGGFVLVDADVMRRHHPDYDALMKVNDKLAANFTHEDAGAWSRALRNTAIAEQRNLIIDQTSRDPSALQVMAAELKKAGYSVELRAMATSETVSEQRIHMRYESQRANSGSGRFSTKENHDAAYQSIPIAVDALERSKGADAIRIYDKDMRQIYENRQENGEWKQVPNARGAMEAERQRPLTEQDRATVVSNYDLIASYLERPGRQATKQEVETINQLRQSVANNTAQRQLQSADMANTPERAADGPNTSSYTVSAAGKEVLVTSSAQDAAQAFQNAKPESRPSVIRTEVQNGREVAQAIASTSLSRDTHGRETFGKSVSDLPGNRDFAEAFRAARDQSPDQSLVQINAEARRQNLIVQDATKYGELHRGDVVSVTTHHSLIKVSETSAIRHENSQLNRPVNVGEKVSIDRAFVKEISQKNETSMDQSTTRTQTKGPDITR